MKKLLIISPYFAPTNAADMQRIRMSLPYLKENGWEAEIVTVDPKYSDLIEDEFLTASIPKGIIIHQVRAFSKKWTSKFGLGSIAIRSLWFYKKYVNQLLSKQHFDLIYFSTTQFPVMILGNYWKKKFNIPYVIDMQDPWHSNYYEDKPKHERPDKYWFSYRLNKYLEPLAMKSVDGLISVSKAYIDTLIERYPAIKSIPTQVITFGAFKPDFDFVKDNSSLFASPYQKEKGCFNFVYVGRGGHDIKPALILLFSAFKIGLEKQPEVFSKIRFHFIGTSYAPRGQGIATIQPIAQEMGITGYVNEQTDRISFYQNIYSLLKADALLIMGSDDPQYTASKIYPYILAEKPLLAFFHQESSAGKIINKCSTGLVIPLNNSLSEATELAFQYLLNIVTEKSIKSTTNWEELQKYNASNMTKNQVLIFNEIINR